MGPDRVPAYIGFTLQSMKASFITLPTNASQAEQAKVKYGDRE